MAVYVDELRTYEGLKGQVARCGKQWCHMTADTEAELHAMADKIGMRRTWFQGGRKVPGLNHYDLVPSRRERAVALGAVEVRCADHVRRIIREHREGAREAGALCDVVEPAVAPTRPCG